MKRQLQKTFDGFFLKIILVAFFSFFFQELHASDVLLNFNGYGSASTSYTYPTGDVITFASSLSSSGSNLCGSATKRIQLTTFTLVLNSTSVSKLVFNGQSSGTARTLSSISSDGSIIPSSNYTTSSTINSSSACGTIIVNGLNILQGKTIVVTFSGNVSLSEIIITPIQTTPLTLTSFKATTQTDGINLNWSTASESNTDKFIVERLAADGSALTVATIKAAGNSTKTLHYAAIDKSAISGKTNYYRLRMLDQDGSFTYSKVIDVKYGITATSLLSTYPNPVSNTLTINLGETSSDFSMLYVVNSKGVVVKKIDVPAKTSQLTLDVSALKTGMYMIEGKLNGKKISSKLFKH